MRGGVGESGEDKVRGERRKVGVRGREEGEARGTDSGGELLEADAALPPAKCSSCFGANWGSMNNAAVSGEWERQSGRTCARFWSCMTWRSCMTRQFGHWCAGNIRNHHSIGIHRGMNTAFSASEHDVPLPSSPTMLLPNSLHSPAAVCC